MGKGAVDILNLQLPMFLMINYPITGNINQGSLR